MEREELHDLLERAQVLAGVLAQVPAQAHEGGQ